MEDLYPKAVHKFRVVYEIGLFPIDGKYRHRCIWCRLISCDFGSISSIDIKLRIVGAKVERGRQRVALLQPFQRVSDKVKFLHTSEFSYLFHRAFVKGVVKTLCVQYYTIKDKANNSDFGLRVNERQNRQVPSIACDTQRIQR